MSDETMRAWIDGATYGELLRRWRFAPAGDPFFQRPMGDYYEEVMNRKKAAVGHAEAVAASKRAG